MVHQTNHKNHAPDRGVECPLPNRSLTKGIVEAIGQGLPVIPGRDEQSPQVAPVGLIGHSWLEAQSLDLLVRRLAWCHQRFPIVVGLAWILHMTADVTAHGSGQQDGAEGLAGPAIHLGLTCQVAVSCRVTVRQLQTTQGVEDVGPTDDD